MVGQGLFAESAMIMCSGFNCIPCMQKMALLSVLVAPAQKRPFYEPSPGMHVFYVLSLGPHFCYPIPSFVNSTGDGWGLIELPRLNFAWPQYQQTEVSTDQEIALPKHHAKCMGRKLLTEQE